MFTRRDIGVEGEDLAAKALKKKGYKLIEKNYRSRFGEIDIIAEEGGWLVFIEVKRRNSMTFGGSLQAVDERKKRRMANCAAYYMKKHECADRKVRFDVVGIDGNELKIVRHAFIVDEDRR